MRRRQRCDGDLPAHPAQCLWLFSDLRDGHRHARGRRHTARLYRELVHLGLARSAAAVGLDRATGRQAKHAAALCGRTRSREVRHLRRGHRCGRGARRVRMTSASRNDLSNAAFGQAGARFGALAPGCHCDQMAISAFPSGSVIVATRTCGPRQGRAPDAARSGQARSS